MFEDKNECIGIGGAHAIKKKLNQNLFSVVASSKPPTGLKPPLGGPHFARVRDNGHGTAVYNNGCGPRRYDYQRNDDRFGQRRQ